MCKFIASGVQGLICETQSMCKIGRIGWEARLRRMVSEQELCAARLLIVCVESVRRCVVEKNDDGKGEKAANISGLIPAPVCAFTSPGPLSPKEVS